MFGNVAAPSRMPRRVVVILPSGPKDDQSKIACKINTFVRTMTPSPVFEVVWTREPSMFRHPGQVVHATTYLEAIEKAVGIPEEIIVVGGSLAQRVRDGNVEEHLESISRKFPGTNVHFVSSLALYRSFDCNDPNGEYGPNVFLLPPTCNSPRFQRWDYWSELLLHLSGGDRDKAISAIQDSVRINVRRSGIPKDFTGEPRFVISAPYFFEGFPPDLEKQVEEKYSQSMYFARQISAGDMGRPEEIDSGTVRVDFPLFDYPARLNNGHYNARIALVRKITELGWRVTIVKPFGNMINMGYFKNGLLGMRFIDQCLSAGAGEVVSVKGLDLHYLPWLRNVGISVGGNVFSGIELEETDLFDVLGIASSRIIPGLGFGCGGSTLIGNGFALIPQRPIEQENGLYEKLRQIETEEYLAAFGLEVFTLPQPLIDLFYDDMRREMGTTRRVVVPSLDLDYKMLLLRQANHLFISSDYYDRFKGQITQTLEKLKKQFGVGVTVAQEDFQYAMNVPELPDGSVVVNAECKNLIAAFDRAKIPYHVISWDFTGSDISCGSYGGLRCAGQFFEV